MNSKMALEASSFGSLGSNKTCKYRVNQLDYKQVCHAPKTYLVILVKPEKGEVGDTDGLPVILDLLTGTVDYMCDFVRHYKL